MKVIGITGGVGMGKSTSATLLKRRGISVCDTDVLARRVVEPGQPALDEIRRAFGEKVIGSDSTLRRDVLGRIVFADSGRRKQLEAITHPRIRQLWLDQVNAWFVEGRACGAIVIPLLYETNAAEEFDVVVCVACSAASQRQRLIGRGWSDDEIARRLAAQWPVQKKMDLADYVVWTEAREDVHDAQVGRILAK